MNAMLWWGLAFFWKKFQTSIHFEPYKVVKPFTELIQKCQVANKSDEYTRKSVIVDVFHKRVDLLAVKILATKKFLEFTKNKYKIYELIKNWMKYIKSLHWDLNNWCE